MSTPTVENVTRIAGINDPVIRNLNITQGYFELSKAMSRYTAGNPNWCTFAVWASKQAGQTIRKEDFSRTFQNAFHNSPEITFILNTIAQFSEVIKRLPEVKAINDFFLKIINPDDAFEHSAHAVAEGNKIVFSEIGGEFARFLSVFKSEQDFTEENINQFCAAFKPGDPPGGQQMLSDAFNSYYQVRLQNDSKSKMELILYADLLIGYHEQTRLQPQIADALNAPLICLDNMRTTILREIIPGFWRRIRHYIASLLKRKLPLDDAIDKFLELVKHEMREVITEFMMTLYVPVNQILKLGQDLKAGFPEELKTIKNSKFNELLKIIDPTPDNVKESGAEDWGNLSDRIHFIADFFRSYFKHPQLYNSPF
ncbi:MAG: hypothetical protein OQK63_09030, partial [Ignavibacteriaceae bacterium]|nr:hypothetical protein [Ignavibacteriaceae bacterium]